MRPAPKTPRESQTPRPSATILLLRAAVAPLEVFMVVRHHEIDFASGALVFPGGKVDAGDGVHALRAHCDGATADPARFAIQVAAIREAFEEAGVLLARDTAGEKPIEHARLAQLTPYRNRLHAGEITMLDFVVQENLRLACDQLVPFAHWITPPHVKRRFDTHFFLAQCPPGQDAVHDGHESVDSVWLTPRQALADAVAGRRVMIFPTVRNLEKLAEAETPTDAVARARAQPVVTVLPWREQRDDGAYLCIPEDAGYPVTAEKLTER